MTAEFTDHQNYGTSYAGYMAAAINGQASYLPGNRMFFRWGLWH